MQIRAVSSKRSDMVGVGVCALDEFIGAHARERLVAWFAPPSCIALRPGSVERTPYPCRRGIRWVSVQRTDRVIVQAVPMKAGRLQSAATRAETFFRWISV